MYRVTRELIKERERFCTQFKPNLIKMHWAETGELNRCFTNALAAKNKDVNGSGSKENPIISGWMVHVYNRQNNTTEIIQHWWNFDPILKIYFDTTPLDADVNASSLEFVEDIELFEFGRSIKSEIETYVGKPLVFMGNKWFTSEFTSIKGELKLTELKDLSYPNLLYYKNKDKI